MSYWSKMEVIYDMNDALCSYVLNTRWKGMRLEIKFGSWMWNSCSEIVFALSEQKSQYHERIAFSSAVFWRTIDVTACNFHCICAAGLLCTEGCFLVCKKKVWRDLKQWSVNLTPLQILARSRSHTACLVFLLELAAFLVPFVALLSLIYTFLKQLKKLLSISGSEDVKF